MVMASDRGSEFGSTRDRGIVPPKAQYKTLQEFEIEISSYRTEEERESFANAFVSARTKSIDELSEEIKTRKKNSAAGDIRYETMTKNLVLMRDTMITELGIIKTHYTKQTGGAQDIYKYKAEKYRVKYNNLLKQHNGKF
jgi:hypothetical protein